MAGSRKAAARFYFHGDVGGVETDALGNHWFNVGDDVPAEVVKQVGSHLFESQDTSPEPPVVDKAVDEKPSPKRVSPPKPRKSPE